MGDRDSEQLPWAGVQRKSRVTLLHAQVDPLTSKLAGRVPEECPGEQSSLLQDLKAVADSQHQSAPIRKVADRLYHRCEARDRAAAQIVTVGKPAGQDDQLQIVQIALAMVDVAHRLAEDLADRMGTVPVTPGAREDDDPRPQECNSAARPSATRGEADSCCSSTRKSSMTALASSWWAMSSTRARARSSSVSSTVITRYLPARTSFTDLKPRACRPPRIVSPAGSLTTGFRVTKTSARYMTPQRLASHSARLAWASSRPVRLASSAGEMFSSWPVAALVAGVKIGSGSRSLSRNPLGSGSPAIDPVRW